MDGYLAKPIDRLELFAAIEEGQPATAVLEGVAGAPVFDAADARSRLGDDDHLLAEIIRIFLDDCPRQRLVIDAAIAAGDSEALSAAAHALKGAAGSLAAPRVADAALALETLGRDRTMADAAAARQRLVHEIDRLTVALNQMLLESTQCAS
jgi:HPt (histidine-containing phosphotransfer) domain-containing protein